MLLALQNFIAVVHNFCASPRFEKLVRVKLHAGLEELSSPTVAPVQKPVGPLKLSISLDSSVHLGSPVPNLLLVLVCIYRRAGDTHIS